MDLLEQDEYAEKHQIGPGFRFGVAWVVASVVCLEIGRSVPDWAANLPISWMPAIRVVQDLEWLWISLFSGLAQTIVLWSYFRWRGALEWLGATLFGHVLRVIAISVLSEVLFKVIPDEISGEYYLWVIALYFSVMVVIGVAGGAMIGLAQRRVLERRVANATRWVWAHVGASALTAIAVATIDLRTTFERYVPVRVLPGVDYFSAGGRYYQPFTIGPAFNILNDFVVSAILAYVLVNLMRHPTPRAEWSVSLRERRTRVPRSMTDSQPSPEVMLERQRQG
jgi:hypothetical protein